MTRNPNAIGLAGDGYRAKHLRRKYLRLHTRDDHEHGAEVVWAIRAETEGVSV